MINYLKYANKLKWVKANPFFDFKKKAIESENEFYIITKDDYKSYKKGELSIQLCRYEFKTKDNMFFSENESYDRKDIMYFMEITPPFVQYLYRKHKISHTTGSNMWIEFYGLSGCEFIGMYEKYRNFSIWLKDDLYGSLKSNLIAEEKFSFDHDKEGFMATTTIRPIIPKKDLEKISHIMFLEMPK